MVKAQIVATHRQACCYWFTGLSGAGKTTLATHVHEILKTHEIPAILLDGDRLRRGLNSDLGFSRADRRENIRRIAETARFLMDDGFIVLVSVISPYQEDRNAARALFEVDKFFEIYVATDLQTCMSRDVKGLYAKARTGNVSQLTGWSDPYEPPLNSEFKIETVERTVDQSAAPLLEHILGSSLINAVDGYTQSKRHDS